MNAILHGANTCTPKKQASQLIVELGKTISNPQRQTLANLYIAVDTANSLLKELEQAHQIIRQCMHEMTDEQILEVAKLAQEQDREKYRLTLNGTTSASGSPSTSSIPQPTSLRRLRLEKIL